MEMFGVEDLDRASEFDLAHCNLFVNGVVPWVEEEESARLITVTELISGSDRRCSTKRMT